MRDLFAQCTYVCVCHARAQECQFAERTGRTTWLVLRNVRIVCGVEYRTQPTVCGIEKRSQGTVEAKRARQKREKVQKKKACCGESSEARYKLCSLFMFDSVVLELHGLPACAMRTFVLVRRGARHHVHA